jgi:hypothetical protein
VASDGETLVEIRDLLREILSELRGDRPRKAKPRKRGSSKGLEPTDLDNARAEQILNRLRSK